MESAGAVQCGLSPVVHGGFPDDDPPALLGKLARVADEGGFNVLWTEDHYRLAPDEIRASEGEPGRDEPLEAWTTLAWLAGQSERVHIGSEVTPLTFRHPAVLAKITATLDLLSRGRVVLGLGTGWYRPDFVSNGIPFKKRTERFAQACEALEVIKSLWSGERVNHQGRYYQLEDAYLAPGPARKGGPPIWFGGISDQIITAAARYGVGWIHATNASPDEVVEGHRRLQQICENEGRDPSEITLALPLMAHLDTDRDKARDSIEAYITRGGYERTHGSYFGENARLYGLWGSPADALERLRPYLDVGVRHFIFDLRPPSIALQTAELLAAEVLPRLAAV